MTTWTPDELSRIESTDELDIVPLREDGTRHDPTTIWVVRDGDDLYVRAVRGRGGAWFRHATARHEGQIRSGGVTKDVSLVEEGDTNLNDRLDTAYRAKYRGYSNAYVDPVVADTARSATLKLVPR
ncbi:DUF2255 family protein [Streptomyces sp. NPDC058001]|uniref:DUF2255 family protein n=1 Tax=Streptomyces sp. NPDC058001 TaxID=3346300 RepID=UPI0036EE3FEA